MNKVFINRHLACSIKFAGEIAKITKPLFDSSHVKYFAYNRFYQNQKWIGIYSDPTPVEGDLSAGRGPLFVDKNGVSIAAGVYFHGDLREILKKDLDSEHVDHFFLQEDNPLGAAVVSNGLLIIRKCSAYDEAFYFSLLDSPLKSRIYYANFLNFLKKYSLYFLYQAKKIIEEAEKNKINYQIPPNANEEFCSLFSGTSGDVELANWLNVNKYCCSTPFGDVYLSSQEISCLRLIAGGHTYVDIANELNLSAKTVAFYAENIKNKLNTNTRAELVKYYDQFSIIDFVD